MKNVLSLIVLAACLVFLVAAPGVAQNKYVGVKVCSPCHKSDKVGKQADIWAKSLHATAYKTLTTPKAAEVAKAKGLKTAANESKECLECHTITADAKLLDKTFDAKDGVQCEVCHGPGSGYKTMATMKDHAKAVAAGLTEYKDAAAIEAKCKTCHNEKSPTFKKFDFKESWAKIQHPRPKA